MGGVVEVVADEGDVVLAHPLMFHSANPNRLDLQSQVGGVDRSYSAARLSGSPDRWSGSPSAAPASCALAGPRRT